MSSQDDVASLLASCIRDATSGGGSSWQEVRGRLDARIAALSLEDQAKIRNLLTLMVGAGGARPEQKRLH